MRQLCRQYLLALSVVLLAVGCAHKPSEPIANNEVVKSDNEVVKSDNDSRLYRYIELPNKLKVLLISDTDTDKAAASLDIHVGSRQDPKQYQGLAHFLEHMLFLGTEKYPEAGEYQAFISANSGSHNAYTSFEHTNYFFDIDPEQFEPALDRFSQFFVAPLFTEEYVEREKNAVHSEYAAKIKDEYRRGADVFKTVINQQHPFAKLSVGTLDTLATDGDSGSLRDQLLTFYGQHYSANIMTLVLIGSGSLSELEAMARQKFSAIKNTNQQLEPIKQPLFSEGSLPLRVQIKPEKSLRQLSITFPTDDDIDLYRQKPMHYLGNILGHEGKGSLLSHLKGQGWVEGLSAGLGLSYRGGAMFNVTVNLTKSGTEHTEQIIDAVFQAINAVGTAKGRSRLFYEQKALSEQQFRYQEKASPIRYVSSLASGMHYYSRQDILSGPYLMTEYDGSLQDHYLSFLIPENSVITLTAPTAETDQTTHFYHVDYSVKPVSREQITRWKQAGTNPDIYLPDVNPFIADDLSIIQAPTTQDAPQLILDKPGLRLWYQTSDVFRSPKGSILFSVESPVASDIAEHKAKMRLLIALMSDELNELSYPAMLAGLGYSLAPTMRGFSVSINGFSDKQDLLLQKILGVLDTPTLNLERFENIKSEHIRQLENTNKRQPYQLITGELPDLLYQNSWNNEQLLAVYRSISLAQIKAYKQLLFAAGKVDVLIYGNYKKPEAIDFANNIGKTLLKEPVLPKVMMVAQLPDKIRSRQIKSDYDDASLVVYLQAKDLDKSRRAALGVSAQIMRSDFYTRLRTEKQLGYIVSSGAYPVLDVPGVFFLVQSPVVGPKQLEREIQQFIQQRADDLATITEADFNQHRNALLLRLSEAPQNLWEQSERYWKDIGQGYYQFDFRQQLIAAMEALSFEQWLRFFVEDVVDNKRRIAIYTTGKFAGKEEGVSGAAITDVESFKTAVPYYSFP